MLGLSMPLTGTAKLILGVLGLLIGAQAIMHINAEGLDPNQNTIEDALGSIGGETVTIGRSCSGPENDVCDTTTQIGAPEAENQFRGLVAFNMLSAVNCNAVTAVHKVMQDNPSDAYIAHFHTRDLNNDKLDKNPFKALIEQTEFDGTCYGANAIDITQIDENIQSLNPLSPDPSSTSNDMEGRQGRIFFEINETFRIGDGSRCGSGSLESEECEEILMGVHMGSGVAAPDKEPPGFWRGYTNAAFLPGNIVDDNTYNYKDAELYADEQPIFNCGPGKAAGYIVNNLAEGITNLDPEALMNAFTGEREAGCSFRGVKKAARGESSYKIPRVRKELDNMEKIYLYRIRMINVPIVANSEVQYDDTGYELGDPRGSLGEGQFEDFVEQAQYKFCEGAQGYVQTNAGEMNDGGESTGSISYKENAVFPAVHITNNKFGGNKTECVPEGKNREFSNFKAHTVNGKTCTHGEAISGHIEEINGEKLQCSYKATDVSFQKFGDTTKTVYRLAWFSK